MRVSSPTEIEKLPQLIMVWGVSVWMLRMFAAGWVMFAAPCTTLPPVGLPIAGVAKHAATATAHIRGVNFRSFIVTRSN